MDNVSLSMLTDSPHDISNKRMERRKTVTFDENLDVQEFDRESSFDRESLQSASSQASSLNGGQVHQGHGISQHEDAMWLCKEDDAGARKVVERLMVVNGSPDTNSSAFDTPDLQGRTVHDEPRRSKVAVSHQHQTYDDGSNDSRDLSSLDEPQSPHQEHGNDSTMHSFRGGESDNTHIVEYNEAADMSGGNLSAYGALHRVESMVDELLGDELLDGHCGKRAKIHEHPEYESLSLDPRVADGEGADQVTDSPPRRRRRIAAKALEQAQESLPAQGEHDLKLSLPAWSPLISANTAVQPTASAPQQSSPNVASRSGRPHISREAVLERVARERRLQEEHRVEQETESLPMPTRPVSVVTMPVSLGLTPAQQAEQIIARRRSKNGLPVSPMASVEQRRRSLSVGDTSEQQEVLLDQASFNHTEVEEEHSGSSAHDKRQSVMLDTPVISDQTGNTFESGLQREISRIYRQGDLKYHVHDRGVFHSAESGVGVGVASNSERLAVNAGDLNAGKAWRKLRRPSDMNEYAKEMRDYRAKENPKRMAGKVFVLVESFTPSAMPVPNRPTRFFCILDNGLHVVRTATSGLRSGGAPSKIGQEFELIQHKNLAFSLTLVAQRDAHLQEPKEPSSPTGKKDRLTPSFSRGMGKLFSSPKKRGILNGHSNSSLASNLSCPQAGGTEPMLKFMNREGAFGQANVVFERVAADCLANCLVVDLAVQGVQDPAGVPTINSTNCGADMATGHLPRLPSLAQDFSNNLGKVRGTLRLKLFYLPPLPGIAKTLLPENIGDCVKGMEAARWHAAAQSHIDGTLTQLGGDCQSWRRRPMKVQGVHLIGFNEITKKATVKIDLSKAISIEENKDPVKNSRGNYNDDDDELDETYHVERSFRITFQDGEKIFFFADSDEEMHRWLKALSKIVGNSSIPAQCAWAQAALELTRSTKSNTITEEQPMRATVPSSVNKKIPIQQAGKVI
jgi:hypothetical protein